MKDPWMPVPLFSIKEEQITKEVINEDLDPLAIEISVEGSEECMGKNI